jgi:hypothetical protein
MTVMRNDSSTLPTYIVKYTIHYFQPDNTLTADLNKK